MPSSKFFSRMEELEEYKRQHGHCDVPGIFPENQALANFVRNHRNKWKNIFSSGKQIPPLQKDEFKIFKEIGFSFAIRQKAFKTQKFEHLVDRVELFKKKHEALWRTGDFNHDSSNLPSDFQDLQTLCENIQKIKISKAHKEVLEDLRVSLMDESIDTRPASMEGGRKTHISFEGDSLSEIFEKKIPGKATQEKHDALEDDSIGEFFGKEIVGTRPTFIESGKKSHIFFEDDSLSKSEVFEKKLLGKETQEKRDAHEDDSIGEIFGEKIVGSRPASMEAGKETHISFEDKEDLTKLCFQEDGPIQVRRSTRSTRNNHNSSQEKRKETSNLCQLNSKKVHLKKEIPNKVRRNTRSTKK